MTSHKLHLAFLKHWRTTALFAAAICILTTFIVTIISLGEIYNQSKQNERILKGLSCILLIQPANRTKENTLACIKSNDIDSKNSNFKFDTLEDIKGIEAIQSSTDKTKTLFIVPIKGDKGATGNTGATGAKGTDGTNGVSIKGDKGDITVVQGIDGKDGETGSQGEPGQNGREIELRTNPSSGNLEWRYVGEFGWNILMKKCSETITTNCIP